MYVFKRKRKRQDTKYLKFVDRWQSHWESIQDARLFSSENELKQYMIDAWKCDEEYATLWINVCGVMIHNLNIPKE